MEFSSTLIFYLGTLTYLFFLSCLKRNKSYTWIRKQQSVHLMSILRANLNSLLSDSPPLWLRRKKNEGSIGLQHKLLNYRFQRSFIRNITQPSNMLVFSLKHLIHICTKNPFANHRKWLPNILQLENEQYLHYSHQVSRCTILSNIKKYLISNFENIAK